MIIRSLRVHVKQSRKRKLRFEIKVLQDESKGMSAAVKLALGETQIAHDTKAFLEAEGVCLDAFNQVSRFEVFTFILF